MKFGRFHIEQLSEGFFEISKNGGIEKIHPSQREEHTGIPSPGKRASSVIGIDPLYVTDGSTHILMDTGLGWGLDHESDYSRNSNVRTNLDIFGVDTEKINFVILSHLHYDHAAGSTWLNPSLETTPTFPNAVYLVRRLEWEYALQTQIEGRSQNGAGYRLDEFYRLMASGRIQLIDEESFTLLPGIDLLQTGGHTPGHQIVRINNGQRDAWYLGDLVPTEYHLNHYAMKQMDYDPVQSKKFKTLLLREAFKNGSHLFFYHALYRKSGKLQKDRNRRYVLTEK